MLVWVARGQAGPPPPLIIKVAAAVTSCRHDTGPAVLDARRERRAVGCAAVVGGDVSGTDQIPVPFELAVRTSEAASGWFGDLPPTGWAGGRGAALVHHANLDAGPFGRVPEGLHQVGTAPLAPAQVLHPAGMPAGDVLGVSNQQGADLMHDRKGDHLLGGRMLGLMEAAAVAGLDPAQRGSMSAPTA